MMELDLNLLAALDVLVQERNVTQAGERMGLSQPAMSYTLNRLRTLLNDPVLVRTSKGMHPTPRALALATPVRRALDDLRAALDDTDRFDPSTSTQRFTIAATDHTELVLLSRLAARLEKRAPKVRIEVVPWRGEETWRAVETGAIDLAVGVGAQDTMPAGLYRKALFEDRFVSVVRRDHPRAKQALPLELFVDLSHVLVSPRGGMQGFVDELLAQRGLARHVGVVVPHFLAAPFIVARSDMVLTLSEWVAIPFAEMLPLAIFPTPLEMPTGEWFSMWHERTHRDPAHRWLREQLVELAATARSSCEESPVRPKPKRRTAKPKSARRPVAVRKRRP